MATPHDALFKRVFSQPHHVAGELRHLLPAAVVAQIDWQTLTLVPSTVVDPQHRNRHVDLLYSVEIAGQQAFLYLLFEHKSWPDAMTPFQLLVYRRAPQRQGMDCRDKPPRPHPGPARP